MEWTFQPGEGVPERLPTPAPQYHNSPKAQIIAQYEAAVTALE